jgi:hypothetical protein
MEQNDRISLTTIRRRAITSCRTHISNGHPTKQTKAAEKNKCPYLRGFAVALGFS